MDKPEPLSDEEITAIWNRFIKQPYDGRTLSAIISHTAQAVAARYEARIAEAERSRDELVQKMHQLERARDALRADAERYRHLRDSGDTSIYAMRFDLEGDTPVDGPDLDASIDAARAAQEKTPATGDQS